MRATNRYENGKSKNQRKMAKWKKKKTKRTPNGEIIKQTSEPTDVYDMRDVVVAAPKEKK